MPETAARGQIRSIASATPCPTPTHIEARPVAAAAALKLQRGGAGDARPRHAEWVAERDRPAVRIDVIAVVRQAEAAQAGERLRGEGFIELDDVEPCRRELQPLAEPPHRRDRPDPHHPRRDARGRVAENAGDGLEALRLDRLVRRHDQRRRAVVDSGRVAGCHAAVGAHDAPQFGERLERRLGAGMLVPGDAADCALAVPDLDGEDFGVERSLRLGRRGAGLRAQREGVLILARDLIVVGDVLGGLGHRIRRHRAFSSAD